MFACVGSDLAPRPVAACLNALVRPGLRDRCCQYIYTQNLQSWLLSQDFMFACVGSELALRPVAACLNALVRPGLRDRCCQHIYTQKLAVLAPQPGLHVCVCWVRPGLEPGAANTCIHRACSPGSAARIACLYVRSDLAS